MELPSDLNTAPAMGSTGASPQISVIMGVYYRRNDWTPLKRAVVSVLEQDTGNFELLICDDGSNERAKTLLDGLAAGDRRIRLLRPENRFSLPEKLNYCLSQAKGKLVARMDDDDYSHPSRFTKQQAYLKAHPEIAFVGCGVNFISADGERIPHRFPIDPTPLDFRFSMPYVHPALMFRRETLDLVGGYSEDKYCLLCEDYDLLLRLYEAGLRGANMEEILFDYSISGVEQKRRSFQSRKNEVIVRFLRFRALRLLPGAWPYVVKPLLVGGLPLPLVNALRRKRFKKQ